MRAVLLVVVLWAYVTCVLTAIGCTAYLAVRLLPGRQARAGKRAEHAAGGAVAVLVLFAIVMMAVAAGLAGGVLWWGRTPGSLRSALALAGLPLWAAVAAGTTALVLWGDRRAGPRRAEPSS
jgi:hypothetical protein